MIFKPELAELVITGRKTQTRRRMSDNPRSPWFRERCAFQVGKDYAVQDKRGGFEIGRIEIIATQRERLGRLLHTDALDEGFKDVQDFIEGWTRINGTYDPSEIVWVLTFRPVPSPEDEDG